MTPQEFANKIRTKYPGAYDSLSDEELTQRIINKYPEYKSQVNLESQPVQQTIEQPQQETYGALFPAKPTDNPVVAGAKALGNVPSSAFNLAKNVGSAILHPIKTVEGLGKVAVGGVEKLIPGQQGQEDAFNQFAQGLKERYGSLENLQRTATNDPFGFGSEILGAITGGASLLGKGAEASNLISKTGQLVTNPVTKLAEGTGNVIKGTTKFATSQATGLNPETITELLKNPSAFKKGEVLSRSEITDAVGQALDTRLTELSDVGKNYNVIRETPNTVVIPENTISKVLNKYGVKLDSNNKILTTTESRPLSIADKNSLQQFIDNFGNEQTLSNNGFLNARENLSQLSKYESGKTSVSSAIFKELRNAYDEIGKNQIKGLKEVDAQYAPEKQLLGQLKKDIFTPAGELKDGAISKIANITGKGKENLLNRVKEIVPDIEQRVNIIKAVEDIERASGLKVGTYARGAAIGGQVLTGNIPGAVVTAILTHPKIATQILRGAGYTGQKAAPILNAVKAIANDINNFRIPPPVLDYVQNPKLGLSVQDITKNITNAEKATLRDFTDAVFGGYKPDKNTLIKLKRDAQEIADKYHFNASTKGDKALATQISDYLDRVGFYKKIK